MTHLMNLRKISNDSLITDLRGLVTQERELTTRILHYLKEIEECKLYLEKGYSSLFAFLTEEMGYSEGAAQRRIQAMRLIKDLPEVEKKIESGELSLTVASQVQGFIQRENKKRRVEKAFKLSSTEKMNLVNKLEGTSSRTCEKKLAEIAPDTGIPREKTRMLNPETTLIQFAAGQDLMKKIQRLKELTSHQNPEGKYEALFAKLVELGLDKLDPERRETRRSKRRSNSPRPSLLTPLPAGEGKLNSSRNPVSEREVEQLKAKKNPTNISVAPGRAHQEPKAGGSVRSNLPPAPAVDRYISPKLKDKIWLRDEGKCQFKDKKPARPVDLGIY